MDGSMDGSMVRWMMSGRKEGRKEGREGDDAESSLHLEADRPLLFDHCITLVKSFLLSELQFPQFQQKKYNNYCPTDLLRLL